MSDKEPPPFGYTFSSDFFHGAASPMDPHGQSLLSDMEGQSLADFFSNTDPFSLTDPTPLGYGHGHDPKLAGTDFTDWNFMAPPTVHHVSATVPDPAALHPPFLADHMFAQHALPPPLDHLQNTSHERLSISHNHLSTPRDHLSTSHDHLSTSHDHLSTTHDDLQAASTLFNNAHHTSYSALAPTNGPMVATSQGLLHERLAALLPNLDTANTLDAHIAAHWANSDVQDRVVEQFGLHRPNTLKRSYTFGTDNSFSNPTAFTAPHSETEDQVTRRLMRNMEHTHTFIPTPLQHTTPDAKPLAPASPTSSNSTSSPASADDDHPTKKRKKSTQPTKDTVRKTAPGGRVGKPKKPSDAADTKKKRISAAAQKLQRENLSEEQKRNNHILSEQKRRNLIKRGFDDLHDLVPEIRNGGLSKSSVLIEAANFLDKLIKDNNDLARLVSGEAA